MIVQSYNRSVFECLITQLNKRRVSYCVIGDYQNLPESIGHDIDIWTDDVRKFRDGLFVAVKESNFKVLIDNQTANGCNIVFYRRDEDVLTLMKIDVLKDTSYKSLLPLVSKDLMRRNVIPYKDFFIANPSSEALMHFLYPMFEWGKIKKGKYKEEILSEFRSEIFSSSMTKLWGKSTTKKILDMIETEQWSEISKKMPSLKRKALFRFVLNPLNLFVATRTFFFALKRFFHPSGFCLAFCGLDGAGKTTILDELNAMFVDLLKPKKVFYGYWRPFVLPEIRELFGKKNSKSGLDKNLMKGRSVNEPEKKPKNPILSLVKLLYYFIDFCLAPLKYGKIRNRGGVVFFDRHYIDMVVHPQRFEMKIPKRFILFLYHFISKADYTFFLWCTPEEIYERKQEFTKEEIQLQTDVYLKTGKKIKNFIPIHTNKSIAKEIDEILSVVAKS